MSPWSRRCADGKIPLIGRGVCLPAVRLRLPHALCPPSPKIIRKAWHAAGHEPASAHMPPGTLPVVFKVGELGPMKGCPPPVDGTDGRPCGRADAHSLAFPGAGHSGIILLGPRGGLHSAGASVAPRGSRQLTTRSPASPHAWLHAPQGDCPSSCLAHYACPTSDKYLSYICVTTGAARKTSNA